MCYYLVTIYRGKRLEETLILPIRKFHKAVFDMLDFNEKADIMFNQRFFLQDIAQDSLRFRMS